MRLTSEIIDDEVSKNALHGLTTKYAWIYDGIYPDFVKQMNLENVILSDSWSKALPRRVIELGAGTARQSLLLRKQGFDVVSLELSPAMVEIGARRLGKERVFAGDMRSFRSSEGVGAIVIGPLVSCYLLNNKDLIETLESAAESLVDGGLLLAEFLPASYVLTEPFFRSITKQQFKVDGGRVTRYNECRHLIRLDVRYSWHSTYIFDLKQGLSTDQDDVIMRGHFPSEIELLFERSGFEVERFLSYTEGRFIETSEALEGTALLAVARKEM